MLHLTGPLIPDTERVLSSLEAETLYAHCELVIQRGVAQDSFVEVAGACGAALVLVTSRDIATVAGAIRAHCGTQTELAYFGLSEVGWHGSLPIEYPRDDQTPSGWLEPVSETIRMPLPTPLREALLYLTKRGSSANFISKETLWDWFSSAASVAPRLTQERCMHTLPTLMYVQTGHCRDWQMLVGHSGWRSTAPLHYYAPTLRELERSYAAALQTIGIELSSAADADQRIGAHKAAISLDRARAAVHGLTKRSKQKLTQSRDAAQRVERYNAMVAYTAAMLICAIGHRGTNHLCEITRRHLLSLPGAQPSHIATVFDKGSDAVTDTRLTAIPGILDQQISALLKETQRLIRHLASESAPGWRPTISALRKTLSGDGPLFVRVAHDGIPTALTAELIAQAWPEWIPPISRVRHLLANELAKHGASGADIAQQMGHHIDMPPHGVADPDSPVMYAARLGPILDDYLRDLGFTTLSEVRRRNDPVPAVHALTARDIARSLREDERGYQQLKKLAKEVPRELDDGTRDMVTNGLDGMPATDTHVVDPESLQTWLAKLESDSDRGTRWALRREIQLALRLRRKTHPGKRAPAVPPPCSPPPEMAAIRAVHLEALRCASSLAQWAHDEFRALTDTAQPVCARQALAGLVLLAQWGMGSRLDQLLAITDASNQLHGAPEWGNAALVEIPIQLGEISEADAPGQMIAAPRQALPVIAYLRRAQAADLVSADTLTAALRDNAQLVRLIGNSEDPLHDMLRIIGASRRLLAGGPRAAWESGELASVGPRLSALVASGSSQVSSVDAPATLAFEQPMLGDEHTSQRWTDFARLRKALNGYAEKPYHRQHRDEVDQLAQAANKAGGDGEIVNVIATLVQRYLHHGRPKWAASTLHNRISLLSSVVSRHAGIDYGREDTDAIVDDLRRLVISYQAGDSQRARKGRNAVIQAIRWLCDGYSRFCEIELSVGDIIGEA